MRERDDFQPTGNPNYPLRRKVFMLSEEYAAFNRLEIPNLPAHVMVDLYLGNGKKTSFYEGCKPTKLLHAKVMQLDEYKDIVSKRALLFPPLLWRTGVVVYDAERDVLSKVEVPTDEEEKQIRIVNTVQKNAPAESERVASVDVYRTVLYQAGVTHAALDKLVADTVNTNPFAHDTHLISIVRTDLREEE